MLDEGRVVDVGTEAELMARCPLFRELVAGPGDDVEEKHRCEGLDCGQDGITPALWPRAERDEVDELAEAAQQRSGNVDSSGFVGGGGGLDVPPTPELIEGVRKLPAAVDEPRLSDVDVTAPDPGFRLAGLLRPVRWPLAVVVALVGGGRAGVDRAAGAVPVRRRPRRPRGRGVGDLAGRRDRRAR